MKISTNTVFEKNYKDDNFITITVDVNGASNGPNCTVEAYESGKTPDRFRINLQPNGKMAINPTDTRAVDAVKVTKNVNK